MKINQKSILATAITHALFLSYSSNVIAIEQVEKQNVETITVTATRSAVNIDDVLSSQIVITRDDIDAINPLSITDILSTVPSIDVAHNGGRGQNSSIFIRGTNSDHALVLIDGVRVSSATLGSTSLNTISPEIIERIEIVQGPRAALWGSDAIGGVIQIFTRQLKGGDTFIGAELGSNHYKQYKAGLGISHGEGQTSVTFSHENSDGIDVRESFEPDEDGYKFNSFAIRGNQHVNEQLTLDWLVNIDQGRNDFDGSFTNGSRYKNHAWLTRASYVSDIHGVKNTTVVSLGQNRDSSDSLLNGQFVQVFETRRDQLSLVNTAEFNDSFQLNTGVDYYQDDVSNSSTVYDQQKRNITGVFAHGIYQLDKLSLESALRYDDVENVDSETSYNVAIGYQVDKYHERKHP